MHFVSQHSNISRKYILYDNHIQEPYSQLIKQKQEEILHICLQTQQNHT
jgi:hypothetical protein